MKGRWLSTFHICQFARKHHVSVDWLIGGDLKGRLRMARNEVMAPRPNPPRRPQWPSDEETQRFRGFLAQMDPADYPAFLAKMRDIVGKRGSTTDGSDEDGAA